MYIEDFKPEFGINSYHKKQKKEKNSIRENHSTCTTALMQQNSSTYTSIQLPLCYQKNFLFLLFITVKSDTSSSIINTSYQICGPRPTKLYIYPTYAQSLFSSSLFLSLSVLSILIIIYMDKKGSVRKVRTLSGSSKGERE